MFRDRIGYNESTVSVLRAFLVLLMAWFIYRRAAKYVACKVCFDG